MHKIQNNTCPPDSSTMAMTVRTSSNVGLVGIAEDVVFTFLFFSFFSELDDFCRETLRRFSKDVGRALVMIKLQRVRLYKMEVS
jgi:hypothetical protein